MNNIIRPYGYAVFKPNAHGAMHKAKSTTKRQDEEVKNANKGKDDDNKNPIKKTVKTEERYTTKKQDAQMNKTLQGVIVNRYIKDKEQESIQPDMNDICNSLLIPDDFSVHPALKDNKVNQKENRPVKKSSLLSSAFPYAASALIATGMAVAISAAFLKSKKTLAPGNVPTGVKLPVVGKNMNLKSEEYFAVYMAISEPSRKNVLALAGVFAMSALTCVGKSFVDAVKKIWILKQEADIKKDFEERSIDIETKSFAGKLDVVRQELVDKANFFKTHINGNTNDEDKSLPPVFGKFISFTGNNQKNVQDEEETFKEKIKNSYDKVKNSPIALAVVSAATLGLVLLGGRAVFKNMGKAAKIAEDKALKAKESIEKSIDNIVDDTLKAADAELKNTKIATLKEKLLASQAEPETITKIFKKLKFSDEEAEKVTNELTSAINEIKSKKSLYVQADPAMGGKEGTQFYIYIDQAKGYIYDVITHPENKFARYLFSSITAAGATGYALKESVDAIKEVAISRENANTDIDLQTRLVDTEIRNFKAKKQSAIQPMMFEFENKLKEGKTKEELKTMADSILLEIKNGPPFVYA